MIKQKLLQAESPRSLTFKPSLYELKGVTRLESRFYAND